MTEIDRAKLRELIKQFWQIECAQRQFVPGVTKIQYSGPCVDDNELVALMDSILDGWFGVGKRAKLFEEQFSNLIGQKYGVLTNSGSSANLLAISALKSNRFENRLVAGDEVIVPAAAFPTTVNPIVQNNLKPVFVDVQLGTYNIDVDQLEKSVSEKTRAVFVLHNFGNPCQMKRINEIA
jgi:CDP-6-deoxy-D-xylo-4-hexulose-3-dehydrase